MYVVVSKVKQLIKEKGQMNTSGDACKSLSKIVEDVVAKAIVKAAADGRKTVMDRDIKVLILED